MALEDQFPRKTNGFGARTASRRPPPARCRRCPTNGGDHGATPVRPRKHRRLPRVRRPVLLEVLLAEDAHMLEDDVVGTQRGPIGRRRTNAHGRARPPWRRPHEERGLRQALLRSRSHGFKQGSVGEPVRDVDVRIAYRDRDGGHQGGSYPSDGGRTLYAEFEVKQLLFLFLPRALPRGPQRTLSRQCVYALRAHRAECNSRNPNSDFGWLIPSLRSSPPLPAAVHLAPACG